MAPGRRVSAGTASLPVGRFPLLFPADLSKIASRRSPRAIEGEVACAIGVQPEKGGGMAKHHDRHSGGSDRNDRDRHDDDDRDRRDKHPRETEVDDPKVHLEIEARRFRGGLPPTADRYRRALEQWNRLPGAVVTPPSDPTPSDDKGGKR